MKNTLLPTLLIVSIVAFSLISCGGGSSSKKSTPPTGGTPLPGDKIPPEGTGGTGGDGADGDGTGGAGDPITYTCTDTNYEPVHDVASLKAISDNMAGNYCLAKDIDLAGVTSGFPLGWKTGGNSIIPFTGNFDGQDNTISNLVINGGGSNLGLFSQIEPKAGESNEIKNLNLDDFEMTGQINVGALTGSMSGAITILKVKINNAMINGADRIGGLVGLIEGLSGMINDSAVIGGTVTCKDYYTGGIIGNVEGNEHGGLTISNSYATSDVSGKSGVGGLVGRIYAGGIISNSYATGAVTGSGDRIGGLLGILYSDSDSSDMKVLSSYATGDVTGIDKVGGLIGKIENRGRISNSYATGMVTITGTGANKGSLIGYISCSIQATDKNHCEATNSYFDKSANSGINAIGAITGGGNPTITVEGVDGAGDIVKAGDGSSNLKSAPATKIFVDWNKDAEVWQFATGAWPTLLHSK